MPCPLPLRYLAALTTLTCLGMGAGLAQAQDTPSGSVAANMLGEVFVSGSRHEQLSDDLPLSIDVIDASSISNSQARDLREAVQNLPNVSVKRSPARFSVGGTTASAGRDGNIGLNIRGLGGNRVLMLTDGIRMPRSYAFRTTTFDREYLSLELLKRVELVRGPASALYGSDGMVGLVNFITYEPADFLTVPAGAAPKTIGGRVSAGWSGDDRGRTLAATVAGKASDSLQWMVTATGRRAHALDTMGRNDSADLHRTTPNPQRDSDNALLGKIVLTPGAGQSHVLTLEHIENESTVQLLSSRAARPFTGTPTQIAEAVIDEDSSRTSQRDRLTWDARFALNAAWADNVKTVLAVQQADSRQLGTSVLNIKPMRVRDNSYAEKTWQAGIQADKTLRSGAWAHQVTYGFDYVRGNISNIYTGVEPLPPEVFPLKRFPNTRETTHALYAQSESVVGDWTMTPGVRYDHFALDVTSQDGFYPPARQPGKSLSGSALSPKMGVLYRATDAWSVFGQYATGFRAPDAGQINGYFENRVPPVIVIPNADLNPEKSRGVELGLRARLQNLKFDAAVFASHYSNLIVDAVAVGGKGTPADPLVFQTRNTERARISGFEVKGVYDWGRVAGGRVSTPFSYGQTRGSNRDNGQPLNSIEPAQWALGLQYDTAPWSLRVDARHHAAKRANDIDNASAVKAPNTQFTIPAAATLDLALQWRLRKDIRLNLAVHNLTDRKYWLWPDVQGLAASSSANDAYTQPGRSAHVSLVMDF